jgi:serine/threonine-protein kinase
VTGATEVYQLGGPGGAGPAGPGPMGAGPGAGARAGDTAVYQAGDLEPEPSSHRKLFLQLGVAVAVIVAVTVGMVTWAGSRKEQAAAPTPTAAAPTTSSASPSATPTETPDPPTSPPTGDPSPGVVTTLGPDDDPLVSLRETPPAKATLGPGQMPQGGWGSWLGHFDEAVQAQERGDGINPRLAAKIRDKIRKAAGKSAGGKAGSTAGRVADMYRELRRAQETGDMDREGPLAEFLDDWRVQDR